MENNDPQKHIEILDECLKAIPLVMPSQFAWPALWHPDLHRGNIFVTEDTPHKLTGIIDWQFAGISPFFHQAKVPKAFRYNGSRVKPVEGTAEVVLPEDFETLPDHEKERVREEEFDAVVHSIYFATTKFNFNVHTLLTHEQFPIIMEPFTSALDSWERGLEEVQFHLVKLSANWEGVADGEECPLRYNEENSTQIFRNFRRFAIYQRNFASLCEKVGCDGYGLVREDIYDTVWTLITELKSKWVAEECGGPYPFEIDQEQKEM